MLRLRCKMKNMAMVKLLFLGKCLAILIIIHIFALSKNTHATE